MKSGFVVYVIGGFLLLGLAGCSGAPSEANIHAAMKKSIDEAMQAQTAAMQAAFGSLADGASADAFIELHGVKKLGCEKTSQGNAYICDIETDVTVPLLGRTTQSGRIRMVKGDGGWVGSNVP